MTAAKRFLLQYKKDGKYGVKGKRRSFSCEMKSQQCAHTKPNGRRCGRKVVNGTPFCFQHRSDLLAKERLKEKVKLETAPTVGGRGIQPGDVTNNKDFTRQLIITATPEARDKPGWERRVLVKKGEKVIDLNETADQKIDAKHFKQIGGFLNPFAFQVSVYENGIRKREEFYNTACAGHGILALIPRVRPGQNNLRMGDQGYLIAVKDLTHDTRLTLPMTEINHKKHEVLLMKRYEGKEPTDKNYKIEDLGRAKGTKAKKRVSRVSFLSPEEQEKKKRREEALRETRERVSMREADAETREYERKRKNALSNAKKIAKRPRVMEYQSDGEVSSVATAPSSAARKKSQENYMRARRQLAEGKKKTKKRKIINDQPLSLRLTGMRR